MKNSILKYSVVIIAILAAVLRIGAWQRQSKINTGDIKTIEIKIDKILEDVGWLRSQVEKRKP